MDDFLIFSNDKNFLWKVKTDIIAYLEKLKLKLHETKCRIFKTSQGFPFLGMQIFPNQRRLKRENVIRFKQRMKKLQKNYSENEIALEKVRQSVCAWLGHSKHANTAKLRALLLEDISFQRQTGERS